MISIKNIHPRILEANQYLLVDPFINLSFYGEFNLNINFSELTSIPTCGVNVGVNGFNFYYNSDFVESLTPKELNFVILHEDFHLLFNHQERTILNNYDHKLANVAQDMIINHILMEDIGENTIEIPKDKDGKNMALFIPEEYTGELLFEELYEWLLDKKENYNKDLAGYGLYSKPINDKKIECHNVESILSNLDKTEGCYLDNHIGDEVSSEMREAMVDEIVDKIISRGYDTKGITRTLGKLTRKKKDYLSYIKKNIATELFGNQKSKTITRPNRRGIQGLKGSKKYNKRINVILDTSGSMRGLIEKVLSYIYKQDVIMNLIQVDTKVHSVIEIKNNKDLDKIDIKGLGGTILQPAVDIISERYNNFNTLILTDGYTDTLNFADIKGRVLVITTGTEIPYLNTKKIKQIKIQK